MTFMEHLVGPFVLEVMFPYEIYGAIRQISVESVLQSLPLWLHERKLKLDYNKAVIGIYAEYFSVNTGLEIEKKTYCNVIMTYKLVYKLSIWSPCPGYS